MGNVTSTVSLQLEDGGFAGKLAADAAALKKFGASSADLAKLGTAGQDALKKLSALAQTSAKLDAFKAGSTALKDQGLAMRQARAEVDKLAATVAKRKASLEYFSSRKLTEPARYAKWKSDGLIKGVEGKLKAEERAYAVAVKRRDATRSAFMDQGRAVRAARNDLVAGGVGRAGRGLGIAAAEKHLEGEIQAANAALREQVALLGRVSAAEVKAAASTKTHAVAAAMATADSKRQAAEAANRRLKAGMSRAGGMGAAIAEGAAAGAAAHGGRRGGHGDEDRRREHYLRHHGAVGYVAAGAAGYASAHGVMGGIERAVHAGAGYQHERVALQNAGRTPEEMREIEEAARGAVGKVPTATYEEALKTVNETTQAFGSLHHAVENLPYMLKTASVLHAAVGDKIQGDAGELGQKFVRFFELRGNAGNTESMQREGDEMTRAMIFTRGGFNPELMGHFAQMTAANMPNYSLRFLSRIVPSLSTELGTHTGDYANAFNNVMLGKANDAKQAEAWKKTGLIDPKKMVVKQGHAVSWSPDAVFKINKALSDPDKFMEEDVLPALRDKLGVNINDPMEVTKWMNALYRNQGANRFAGALAQPSSIARLHKDSDLMDKTDTPDAIYRRNLSSDPTEALKALTASLESLSSAATSPAMATAASVISALASQFNALAGAAKDHPIAAMATGATVAGGALAGAGALSYQLLNGFGLGASATALDGSAAALTAAAAELGGAGVLGKIPGGPAKATGTMARMGALGFIGTAGLGVAAIGAGVMAVDATLPNANRMNGNGRQFRRPGGIESYPSGWGPGGVNVAGGVGAATGPYTTHRDKTWGEALFGGATGRGARDVTRMDLPLPPGMMPAPPKVQQPGFSARPVPLPPGRPGELGGAQQLDGKTIAPKVEVQGADAAQEKLGSVKTKGEELGALKISVPVEVPGAGTAIQQLERLISLAGQANRAVAGVGSGGEGGGRSA